MTQYPRLAKTLVQPNGNDPKVILVLALAIYYILQNLVPHAGTKITYSELVGDLGPMPPPNEELHYRDSRLDEAIGELVAACRARGLPAISALVIREVERNPGAGYYSTAHPAEWAKDRMLAEVAWAKERELARQTSYPARLSALTPNKAFAFDVDDRASRRDRLVADGPVARAVEVDAAVRPHLRQEVPAVAADGFEVLLAGIPRIEADVAGREAALLGGGPHFPAVVVWSSGVPRPGRQGGSWSDRSRRYRSRRA